VDRHCFEVDPDRDHSDFHLDADQNPDPKQSFQLKSEQNWLSFTSFNFSRQRQR